MYHVESQLNLGNGSPTAATGSAFIFLLLAAIAAMCFVPISIAQEKAAGIAVGAEGRDLTDFDLRPPIDKDSAFMHRIPALQTRPGLKPSGAGTLVGIWDGGPVLGTHKAFGGRVEIIENNFQPSNHATHVAGTIAAGPVDVQDVVDGIGVAQNARIASFDFCVPTEVAKKMKSAITQNPNMRVTNHSWGVKLDDGREEFEQIERDFDAAINENPSIVAFVAAGNDRRYVYDIAGIPTYQTPPIFGNLRSPGIAKNVITVGAMIDLEPGDDVATANRAKIMPTYFSSIGPTLDGRIKPDVIANGWDLIAPSTFRSQKECLDKSLNVRRDSCEFVNANNRSECYQRLSGTSMATPVTAGVGALLQELAMAKRKRWLLADEMKAILIHTAVTKDNRPTYLAGWGAYRADLAGNVIDDWQDDFKPNSNGEVFTRLTVFSEPLEFRVARLPEQDIKLTLVWLDKPSKSPGTGLENDLDMSLSKSVGGDVFFPWTLDPLHPEAPAIRGVNSRDNVERIDITTNEALDGEWILRIKPTKTSGAPVSFALIASGIKLLP